MRDSATDNDVSVVRFDLDALAVVKPGGLHDLTGKNVAVVTDRAMYPKGRLGT
jgi:hypothetical protein